MTVAGKAPAEPDELDRAVARGCDAIELYLERSHLEDVEATIELLEAVDIEVASVHTLHVPIDEPEWLHRSDRLADALGAYLVVHSNRIVHTFTPDLEALDFRSAYGYEHNPGISERHIRGTILDPGHELVLDTAHLYMAERDYLSVTEQLLREFGDQVRVVHLCDSSLQEDGLGFGDGSIDMRTLSELIGQYFEGILVLEVMPDRQREARERLRSYWSDPK
ncbi:xylose isomerase [Halobacteriales archaeon QS_3_64_16]|nr:MAG: xylose isomerase [Halobacteriales archaeon QS_3_64_16]